jgi:hypothetical protein
MDPPHLHPELADERDPKRLKNNKAEDVDPDKSQPPPANPDANAPKKVQGRARLLEFLPREKERSDEEQKLTRRVKLLRVKEARERFNIGTREMISRIQKEAEAFKDERFNEKFKKDDGTVNLRPVHLYNVLKEIHEQALRTRPAAQRLTELLEKGFKEDGSYFPREE